MYAAKVLLDSVSPAGYRLTTMEVTFPRFILAEFNTHRMLSRNAASSRAIPVAKRIQAVIDNPFVPEVFGKNQKGMQAGPEVEQADDARDQWLSAAAAAVRHARELAVLDVHKQLANRLLEPFAWVTVVVSATEWDNFFHLRDHPDAQPEFQIIARMMREAREASEPVQVAYGGWHLPYIVEEDFDSKYGSDWESMCMISTARCARVSYLTHDGKRDLDADVDLGLRLMAAGHMSPFEHAARAASSTYVQSNFVGWTQFRKLIPMERDRLRPIRVLDE